MSKIRRLFEFSSSIALRNVMDHLLFNAVRLAGAEAATPGFSRSTRPYFITHDPFPSYPEFQLYDCTTIL